MVLTYLSPASHSNACVAGLGLDASEREAKRSILHFETCFASRLKNNAVITIAVITVCLGQQKDRDGAVHLGPEAIVTFLVDRDAPEIANRVKHVWIRDNVLFLLWGKGVEDECELPCFIRA